MPSAERQRSNEAHDSLDSPSRGDLADAHYLSPLARGRHILYRTSCSELGEPLEMTVTTRWLTLACCFAGTAALAAESTKPFSCEGPFGHDSSYAKLVSTYGAANLTNKQDAEADAEVTILFPNDPKRRLKIEWENTKARRNPKIITMDAHSSWSVAGVAIGTSLIELERLNGGPFKFNYFEGDYGGAITDWLGGHFKAQLSGGCWLGAFVGIDDNLPKAVDQAVDAEVTQDRSLLSTGWGVRAANLTVTQILVSFPK